MSEDKPLGPEHRIEIVAAIIFSIITCGLYNVYWQYRQMLAVNLLLGEERYRFGKWLLLSIVTCGIYHVFYEYWMGQDIQSWMKSHGREVNDNLAVLGLAMAALGLSVISDGLYQYELNKLAQ